MPFLEMASNSLSLSVFLIFCVSSALGGKNDHAYFNKGRGCGTFKQITVIDKVKPGEIIQKRDCMLILDKSLEQQFRADSSGNKGVKEREKKAPLIC